MKNPVISQFQPKTCRAIIASLAVFNVILIASMLTLEGKLAPFTVVEFELAGSTSKAQVMLQTWRTGGAMPNVFFLLGFDYLFMMVYSFSLWFACLHVADAIRSLEKLVIVVAWLQPVAAVLDAIENGALFQVSLGATDDLWPSLAYYCAVPKFLIVCAALILWIVCGCVKLYKKRRPFIEGPQG